MGHICTPPFKTCKVFLFKDPRWLFHETLDPYQMLDPTSKTIVPNNGPHQHVLEGGDSHLPGAPVLGFHSSPGLGPPSNNGVGNPQSHTAKHGGQE